MQRHEHSRSEIDAEPHALLGRAVHTGVMEPTDRQQRDVETAEALPDFRVDGPIVGVALKIDPDAARALDSERGPKCVV